ncbi:MAG: outer membrane protein assembly factor, partial [Bergeyella zoohelcum]|nr:outer membrane protein assembly factor [Bergeyella zoohelcum]
MSSKHFQKYFQKYQLFFSVATSLGILYSCSTTKKVPEGDYLLTKNTLKYTDTKAFSSELPSYITQKPNKKTLFLFPFGLWMYNAVNPKYDALLEEYNTYPSEMRNQNLRDSLFVKYDMPQDIGKNLLRNRFLYNLGQAPTILDESKTKKSAENIKKRLVYRGYWDAKVSYQQKLDSSNKKASVDYTITQNKPTIISEYYYNIPDAEVKKIYESNLRKTKILTGDILDQTLLEQEVSRISDLMQQEGYYKFNASKEDIYFTADTLRSRKEVPLIMDIRKDSIGTPYNKTMIGDINVYYLKSLADVAETEKDSLMGINFHKQDNQYKTIALWRPITLQ